MRVRPYKIGVLIPWEATKQESLLAISFLSRIWGGRYCPIIPIASSGDNQIAKSWLLKLRPDVIVAINVDHEYWIKACKEMTQPYAYIQLAKNNLHEWLKLLPVTIIPSVFLLEKIVNETVGKGDPHLIIPDRADDNSLAFHLAATFGVGDKDITNWFCQSIGGKTTPISSEYSPQDYLTLCKEGKNKWSLLDLGSYKLQTHEFSSSTLIPKTIVVGAESGSHLALFWNMRMLFGVGSSGKIQLFSKSWIENEAAVLQLADWILTNPIKSNYIYLISLENNAADLVSLREKLILKIGDSGIEFIDNCSSYDQIPSIIGYEEEKLIPIEIDNRVIKFIPPRPSFNEYIYPNAEWMLDISKDFQTGRSPMELFGVFSEAAKDILNTPFPPKVSFPSVDKLNFSVDGIKVRCGMSEEIIQFYMPPDVELIEQELMTCGLEIEHDEKRRYYEACMTFFDDLEMVGRSFSGFSRRMLNALQKDTLTLEQD